MRDIGHDSSDGQGTRPLGEGVAGDPGEDGDLGEVILDGDHGGEPGSDGDSAFGEGDLSSGEGSTGDDLSIGGEPPTGGGPAELPDPTAGEDDAGEGWGDWYEDGDPILFAEAGEADADQSTADGGLVEGMVDRVTGLFGGEDDGSGGDEPATVDFLD